MLRVRLLGELGLEIDGHPVAVPTGRPARTLLAWLALHPGVHQRSRLAGNLWPEVLEESARTSLRGALAAVRRTLGSSGAPALVARREEVGLAEDVWVDVRAFDELAAHGRVDEALDLCRGELLPGLNDDWAHEAREEHRARWGAALAAAADLAQTRGDLELALRRTREWVRVDPLAEDAHRALIRRLDARGERGAALTAYAALRERLRRTLGVAPSRETRALVEHLRGDEVAAVRPPFPPLLARLQRSVFAGRARELRVLANAWDRAQRGDRPLVTVAGEPGVGKTRLAAEFAHRAHLSGATVLLGRAHEQPLVAYQPFAEALRPYLVAPGEIGALGAFVPGRATADSGANADPRAARFRLFEGVSELLAAATRERPLLLVLDDLQWADEGTLLLLAHLVRAPEPARLLVLATYREQGLRPEHALFKTLVGLRRDRVVEHLVLGGLSDRDVGAIVESWTAGRAPATLATAIHRETDGNPLFVEELLRQLGDRAPVAADVTSLVAEIGIPPGVKDVIAQRVATLSADAGLLVAAASVVGADFDSSLLESLSGVPVGDGLVEALDECLQAALIREDADAPDRYRFAHPLVREAVYDGLGGARRAKLHAQLAAALEDRFGDRADHVAELAHHWARAPGPDAARRASAYDTRAGGLALGQLAYEQAAWHFERALVAVDRTHRADDAERCELLLALGDARMRAGQRDRARGAFGDAAAAARRLRNVDLLARAALGFGGIGVIIAEPDEAVVRLLEEALHALGARNGALRARLLARLAVELYYAPDRRCASQLSARALQLARTASSDLALSQALSARHVALWRPDHVDERLAIADQMVDLGQRTGDPAGTLQGMNWLILDLFDLGDRDRIETELDAYAEVAAGALLPAYQWYAPMWRATLALLEGRPDDAGRLWSQARALGARGGDANTESFFRIVDSYHLPAEQGRFDRVDIEFHRERAHAPAAGAAYRVGLARILAELGRHDEARAELERAAPQGFRSLAMDMNRLSTLAELARVCALLGDESRAAEGYELLLPYAGLNIVDARAIYCYGSAAYYLGLYAVVGGRPHAAREHLEAALGFNRAMRAWPHVCRTLTAYAAALAGTRGRADGEHARQLMAEARTIAERLHMEHLVEGASTGAPLAPA